MEYQTRECPKHGETQFRGEKQNKSGYVRWRCVQCCYQRQLKSVRKTKEKLVELCGGGCQICGYNKCLDALDFHHKDRSTKSFNLSVKRNGLAKKVEEAKKCLLVCCRCHREIEAQMVAVV